MRLISQDLERIYITGLMCFPLQTLNLSSRKDDILPIAIKILDKHNHENKSAPYLTSKARELLLNHNWPGNVRELENTLQRALVLCNQNIIDEKSIMIDKSLSKINENSSVDTFANQLAFAKVIKRKINYENFKSKYKHRYSKAKYSRKS